MPESDTGPNDPARLPLSGQVAVVSGGGRGLGRSFCLALAAQGEVVLIGRGAGCILPRTSTLNVRLVAPLADRIAYMGQWLRLPLAEAEEKVRSRDQRRAEFLQRHFDRLPGDLYQYDVVLNSSMFGEEGCADLIGQAAHIRWTALVEGA